MNSFKLKNCLKSSSLAGVYLADITTYLADGTTIKESYSDYIIFNAKLITVLNGNLFGSENSKSDASDNKNSILFLSFTLTNDIPVSPASS